MSKSREKYKQYCQSVLRELHDLQNEYDELSLKCKKLKKNDSTIVSQSEIDRITKQLAFIWRNIEDCLDEVEKCYGFRKDHCKF